MAEFYYPFAAGPGAAVNETDWSHLARHLASSGVVGDPGGNQLEVFADSTGRHVKVRPGQGITRGHYYLNDAIKQIDLDANPSGSTRLDLIVLRLNPTANTVIADKVTGTPGAGAPPVPTQSDTDIFELPLGVATVIAGATTITFDQVTDARRHSGLDVIPCRVVADIPIAMGIRRGQLAYEVFTGLLKIFDGATWGRLTPTRQVVLARNGVSQWGKNFPAAGSGFDDIIHSAVLDVPAGALAVDLSVTTHAVAGAAPTACTWTLRAAQGGGATVDLAVGRRHNLSSSAAVMGATLIGRLDLDGSGTDLNVAVHLHVDAGGAGPLTGLWDATLWATYLGES